MITQVSDGTRYRIQFVHSGHDLTVARDANPGGLRQTIDNLAKSIRRRVSFAEIARVEMIQETKRGPQVQSFVPLSQGFSICYHGDAFVKSTGRGRAFYRALKQSGLDKSVQSELAVALGFPGGLAEVKMLFSDPHGAILNAVQDVRSVPYRVGNQGLRYPDTLAGAAVAGSRVEGTFGEQISCNVAGCTTCGK